jgi:hypothetical protein
MKRKPRSRRRVVPRLEGIYYTGQTLEAAIAAIDIIAARVTIASTAANGTLVEHEARVACERLVAELLDEANHLRGLRTWRHT